jgi:hypothetical protein
MIEQTCSDVNMWAAIRYQARWPAAINVGRQVSDKMTLSLRQVDFNVDALR